MMCKMYASVVWYYNPAAFASSNLNSLYNYLHPTSNKLRILTALMTLEVQARDMDKVIHPAIHSKVKKAGGPLQVACSHLRHEHLPNFYDHLMQFNDDKDKWENLVENLKQKKIGCLMRVIE